VQDSIKIFTRRLHAEWLPSFCEAPHRNYSSAGFKEDSINKLSEYDAYWFMRAVDTGLVSESEGYFVAPQSKAKEQIFWEGEKAKSPRPITLWVEPIITIGALARLNQEFGWPNANLGAQSKTWAFDLVCYDSMSNEEWLVCEVKKHGKEIEVLLHHMNAHCVEDPKAVEPENSKERNAYRKVQGVRNSWPSIFWALGPQGEGKIFQIQREGESQRFCLISTSEDALKYEKA